MSILSIVPGILASAFGQPVIYYRATKSGEYAVLEGAHLGNRVPVLTPDDERAEEYQDYESQMTVPESSTVLEYGFQVRVGDSEEWAVQNKVDNSHHGVRSYIIRRRELIRRSADRGALR